MIELEKQSANTVVTLFLNKGDVSDSSISGETGETVATQEWVEDELENYYEKAEIDAGFEEVYSALSSVSNSIYMFEDTSELISSDYDEYSRCTIMTYSGTANYAEIKQAIDDNKVIEYVWEEGENKCVATANATTDNEDNSFTLYFNMIMWKNAGDAKSIPFYSVNAKISSGDTCVKKVFLGEIPTNTSMYTTFDNVQQMIAASGESKVFIFEDDSSEVSTETYPLADGEVLLQSGTTTQYADLVSAVREGKVIIWHTGNANRVMAAQVLNSNVYLSYIEEGLVSYSADCQYRECGFLSVECKPNGEYKEWYKALKLYTNLSSYATKTEVEETYAKVSKLTQAEYDALSVKDTNTIYIING